MSTSARCPANRTRRRPSKSDGTPLDGDHRPRWTSEVHPALAARPRLSAVRVAAGRRADQAGAVRRAFPRNVRRCARPVRAAGDKVLRAAQQEERCQRADLRRREGHCHRRGQGSPRRVRRGRSDQHGDGPGHRRRAAAHDRGPSRLRLVLRGQRQHHGLPHADDRQRQPAGQVRQPRPDRRVPQADAGRPVLRDDGAFGDPGGLVAGRHPHPCRTAGRRHVSAVRIEDVDLRRRTRAHRQHRQPRARQDSRRSGRHQGHLAVHRAQVPRRRRRRRRRTQRRGAGRAEPQDGPAGHHQHGAQLRRRNVPPRWKARRGRLSGRRAAPRHHLHVPR